MDMTRLKEWQPRGTQPVAVWYGASAVRGVNGRKYCSQACRQRAYEQRNAIVGTVIPAEAIIPAGVKRIVADSLFELVCRRGCKNSSQ